LQNILDLKQQKIFVNQSTILKSSKTDVIKGYDKQIESNEKEIEKLVKSLEESKKTENTSNGSLPPTTPTTTITSGD